MTQKFTFFFSWKKHTLSRYQIFSFIRFSSFLQGSICIYSPHTPPNFIQIQRHSSELHSISDSKSTYIPLSCHQNAIPSDWAHFHRADSTYSAHVPLQISSKSNTIRQSYTRFPTQRALIYLWVATKSRSPSDWTHFHRVALAYTRHALNQIWMKSNGPHWSY